MKKRVLFSGYAPVHFLCFYPVYKEIVKDPNIEVWLSGGFREKKDDGVSYRLEGFYDSFDVDKDKVISVEQSKQEDFDVLVCAHSSDGLFPRSVAASIQIFHGVSFKNFAVRDKVLKYDYLCIPGEYHAELFRANGLIKEDGPKAFITGFAKTDPLVTQSINRVQVLRNLGLSADKPTILYAPTGGKKNSLETMGRQVVEILSGHAKWNVIVKPHDHPKNKINWFKELGEFENGTTKLVRGLDVIPLLSIADLLISDASSVVTEFSLVDRPIVFLDVPHVLKRVVKRGGKLDLDTFGRKVGPVVTNAENIARVVARELGDSGQYATLRQEMASQVFFDPGRARDRVAGIVRYVAGLQDQPPSDAIQLNPEVTL